MTDKILTDRATVEAMADSYKGSGSGVADLLLALLARAESAEAERDEARRAVKIVQNAARVIGAAKSAIIRNLEKPRREEREAVATLNSERDANSILTGENDRLRSDLTAARETIAAVTKQREDADHDADLARSQLGSVAMDNADLRATIARLTAEPASKGDEG